MAVAKDPLRLRPWTNTKLGEPFEDRDSEAIEAVSFLSRLEDWSERLPEGVVAITVGVDVQGDRLEFEIVGWGAGEESWSLSYEILWGDPARPEIWATLDTELLRRFDHPRVGSMGVSSICIDTGGHHTQTVYAFARDRRGRGS